MSDVNPPPASMGTTTTDILKLLVGLVRQLGRELIILFGIAWSAWAVFEAILAALFDGPTPSILELVTPTILPAAFFTAAIAHMALYPERARVRDSFMIAGRAFWSVLAALVLVRVLIALGFLMLVLPGLLALIAFGLTAPIIIAERPGVLASLQLSAQRVFAAFGAIVLAYLVFGLILMGSAIILMIISAIVLVVVPETIGNVVFEAGLATLFSVVHTLFAVAIYKTVTPLRPVS